MAYATLMMIGGTLFINGLVVLGKVDPKGAAPYNIFTGILATVVPFYLLSKVNGVARADFDTILGVAPMWLFALTFLWVGLNAVTDFPPSGVGWYCLWVVVMAVAFGLVNFIRFDAPREGVIWMNWAVLWGLFWLLLAMGRDHLSVFTGWAAVLMSVWTVTAQAILNLVGAWSDIPAWAFYVATAVTLVVSLAFARRAANVPAAAQAGPSVADARVSAA
jgi:putative amide transporter protein